MVKQWRLGRR